MNIYHIVRMNGNSIDDTIKSIIKNGLCSGDHLKIENTNDCCDECIYFLSGKLPNPIPIGFLYVKLEKNYIKKLENREIEFVCNSEQAYGPYLKGGILKKNFKFNQENKKIDAYYSHEYLKPLNPSEKNVQIVDNCEKILEKEGGRRDCPEFIILTHQIIFDDIEIYINKDSISNKEQYKNYSNINFD